MSHDEWKEGGSRRRCLLSGASGYVGSRIKEKLQARGWEVIELSRHPKSGSGAIEYRLGQRIDPEKLKGYAALVHCAYDFNTISWSDIRAVNVEGAEHLLRSARQAGVERLVFISTISAFDKCQSLYGKGKLEVEQIARLLGAWVIRPGLVYGEGPGGMFGRLVQQVKRSVVLPIPGSGMQLMHLVHESDLTDAVLRCLETERKPSEAPITVAHEQSWSFRSILFAIAHALNRKLILLPVPWRLMWLGLRSTEALRIPLGLRSDSLVSLVNQDPSPVLNAPDVLGVQCRPFEPEHIVLATR